MDDWEGKGEAEEDEEEGREGAAVLSLCWDLVFTLLGLCACVCECVCVCTCMCV